MQPTQPEYRAALALARKLRDAGHQAFFAGGCVRDLLLGMVPKDYDVATSATPDEIVALFPKTFTVGAHFGVVLVCGTVDGAEIATEVATFRNDGAYSDGRRPDAVRFSTDPREDVQRRDFTINGMLLDPIAYEATLPRPPSILSVAAKISHAASSAPSATRSCATRKTSCACCAPSDSPRG